MPVGADKSTIPSAPSEHAPSPASQVLTDGVFEADSSGAWVLAREGFFRVSSDKLVKADVPEGGVWTSAALATDGGQLYAALVFDASTIHLSQSTDNGISWAVTASIDLSTIGISGVSISANASDIVLLASESSSNVSSGQTIASHDGGRTWTTERAPTGGQVGFAGGTFWLVGGVTGAQLYVSDRGSDWSPVRIPQDGDWTAGLPWTAGGDGAVVATTTHTDGESAVTFWTTTDRGMSWSHAVSMAAPLTEVGVSLPTTGDVDGRWMVVLADGSKLYAGLLTDKEPRIVSPNGLPRDVVQVAQLEGEGVLAYGASTACPTGKSSCVSKPGIWYSADGGQTWEQLP